MLADLALCFHMNREHLGEEADLQKIKALLKENNPVWKQTRLTALNMGFNGEISLNFIAESLGVSVSSVRRWFVTFRREGLDGVLIPFLKRECRT